MCQTSLSITSSPELAQTHVRWVSDAIQPSYPVSPTSPAALNLSQHQGLSQWVSSLPQVARVLELQLQPQSFQWIFWVDFLAVQGTFKSLLQHHSLRASILLRSTFFMVQLSHPYMTTGKTIALIIWTFVGKVPNTLPSWISFSLEWFWSLPPVQCHEPPSIVFQVLCLPDLILWICLSLLLYNLKGFDLGDTWMAWVIFPTFFNLSLNF